MMVALLMPADATTGTGAGSFWTDGFCSQPAKTIKAASAMNEAVMTRFIIVRILVLDCIEVYGKRREVTGFNQNGVVHGDIGDIVIRIRDV